MGAFIACRLIPPNKIPCLRAIGVEKVLRRIAEKMVNNVLKKYLMKATGLLQVCASQEVGVEAASYATCDIYNDEHSETDLLINTENAFNSINKNVMLHIISVLF